MRSSDGRALARDRRLVAAGDRAGERALGAERGPVLDRGAHERGEQRRGRRRRWRQALGGALERDEEVRGDRGGRVVGGAVLVGDAQRAHPERARPAPRAVASARGVAAVDRGARAGERLRRRAGAGRSSAGAGRTPRGRPAARAPCRAGAVADERAGRDGRRGGRDLARPARTAARRRAAAGRRRGRAGRRRRARPQRSAAARAVPRRPAPTMAIESSSRMRYRLQGRGGVRRFDEVRPGSVTASPTRVPRERTIHAVATPPITQRAGTPPAAAGGRSRVRRVSLPPAQRRDELKAVWRQASACTRCPQLAADAPDRRLRLGQRRRRPDVRRRGARAPTRTSRACRSSARPAGCWTSCSARSASSAATSSSRTSSSAALPATATRCRRRSTPARTTCSASSS